FEAHANESLQPLYQWFLADIELAAEKSLAGLAMLDIGCGPGFMLEKMVEAGASIVAGVDLSYSMLECAVRSGRSDQAILLQADVTRLPLRPASFDIIFSRGSIFFWQDLETAFKSIAAALKPGGIIILGGGYGLSTPQHLVDAVRSRSGSDQARSIPKIDHDLLLKLARKISGTAEIKAAPKRGFWLIWRPHCNN
ncbi:MAG: class I SAM-dependent methyltransferase, partial [Candidatus Riflebacteria bacterium]|nr:class I SAM-dependent methyltransferase [Candidatus Riflebacteria bacterium]